MGVYLRSLRARTITRAQTCVDTQKLIFIIPLQYRPYKPELSWYWFHDRVLPHHEKSGHYHLYRCSLKLQPDSETDLEILSDTSSDVYLYLSLYTDAAWKRSGRIYSTLNANDYCNDHVWFHENCIKLRQSVRHGSHKDITHLLGLKMLGWYRQRVDTMRSSAKKLVWRLPCSK